jgi:hypothetical protein
MYPGGAVLHWDYELRDDIPDGAAQVWHPNGSLRSEGNYVEGRKHGRFRFYDETGAFEHQAVYLHGQEVWSSDDQTADPSDEITRELGTPPTRSDATPLTWSHDPVPAPYFGTLDRTTGLNRIGGELGMGNIRRTELYANYMLAHYGLYGQVLQTNVDSNGGAMYSGKRTAELDGTRRFSLGDVGTLVARAGVVVPVGNDDQQGFIASSLGSTVMPSDVATSFPSTVAVRTGASLTRSRKYFVLQGDAGVDWIVAGQTRPLDALLRANAGLGVGGRAAMVSIEVSNTALASDPSRSLHAVAFAGTLWFARMWGTGVASFATNGQSALTIGVGREL